MELCHRPTEQFLVMAVILCYFWYYNYPHNAYNVDLKWFLSMAWHRCVDWITEKLSSPQNVPFVGLYSAVLF